MPSWWRTTRRGRRGCALRGAGQVRLLGASAATVTAVTGGRPDLAVYAGAATEAGRLEPLPFLREQAVSITAHRFGTPDHLTDGLL